MSTLLAWRVAYVQFLIVSAKTSPRDHCISVTCCLSQLQIFLYRLLDMQNMAVSSNWDTLPKKRERCN